jgi:hypothetical protein
VTRAPCGSAARPSSPFCVSRTRGTPGTAGATAGRACRSRALARAWGQQDLEDADAWGQRDPALGPTEESNSSRCRLDEPGAVAAPANVCQACHRALTGHAHWVDVDYVAASQRRPGAALRPQSDVGDRGVLLRDGTIRCGTCHDVNATDDSVASNHPLRTSRCLFIFPPASGERGECRQLAGSSREAGWERTRASPEARSGRAPRRPLHARRRCGHRVGARAGRVLGFPLVVAARLPARCCAPAA